MFPFNFEWVWDIGHIIFFGGFWYAIGILAAGMIFCILKSALDTLNDNGK